MPVHHSPFARRETHVNARTILQCETATQRCKPGKCVSSPPAEQHTSACPKSIIVMQPLPPTIIARAQSKGRKCASSAQNPKYLALSVRQDCACRVFCKRENASKRRIPAAKIMIWPAAKPNTFQPNRQPGGACMRSTGTDVRSPRGRRLFKYYSTHSCR